MAVSILFVTVMNWWGASFDKALEFLPGQLAGTVMRGEIAYNFGLRQYEPDLETLKADSVTALIGLDQYLYHRTQDHVQDTMVRIRPILA